MSQRLRILAVDDEEVMLGNYELMLREHEVITTTDPTTVVGKLQAGLEKGEPFNLLITDDLMPGLSGCGLIKKVRIMGFSPVILMISGTASPEVAIDAGANRVLGKPFDVDDLRKLVESYAREEENMAACGDGQ